MTKHRLQENDIMHVSLFFDGLIIEVKNWTTLYILKIDVVKRSFLGVLLHRVIWSELETVTR